MTDWTHGGEFPVANVSRVQTVGIEQMHAQFSRLVRPHDMDLIDRRADFVSELRYAPLSRSVLSDAIVGAAMKVRARENRDVCLALAPVNAPIGMTIGSRRTVIPVGAVEVVPSDVPFEVDIARGDSRSLMFEVEMDYLETVLAEETGDSVSRPLRFANDASPCGVGEYFLTLLEFVQQELMLGATRCTSTTYVSRLESLVASALLFTKPHNYSNRLHSAGPVAEPRCVRRAEDYMRAHAGEHLDLKAIAVAAAVSPRTLIRGFRKYKRCSPVHYLRNIRLDNCRRELVDAVPEDASVTAVAMKWGFSNLGRFASLYRQRFGENPLDTLRRS